MELSLASFVFPGFVGVALAGAAFYVYGELTLMCGSIILAAVVALALTREYMNGGMYRGKERIVGKTVIITGANTGIGKETARDLARRGGRIIMACRNTSKGEAAVREIVHDTGNNNVVCWQLDLGSFKSIREFAKKFNESEPRLDILLNNAGIMGCPKTLTEDGLEMQMGTNHFGHYLLTNLLLDKLKSCAPSRIINVSSIGHANTKGINFDDLMSEKSYSRVEAYAQSKLANVLHANELTRRLKGTGVTANSLHPGAVETELVRHILNPVTRFLLTPVYSMIVKDVSQGAQTSIRLAVDPSLETVSGKYFSDCQVKAPNPAALDEAQAKRFWEVTEEIIQSKSS